MRRLEVYTPQPKFRTICTIFGKTLARSIVALPEGFWPVLGTLETWPPLGVYTPGIHFAIMRWHQGTVMAHLIQAWPLLPLYRWYLSYLPVGTQNVASVPWVETHPKHYRAASWTVSFLL
jgi:hypothetical protein